MTTQLIVFNIALGALGERKAITTSDATEPVRRLTEIWDAGARDYCLEQGHWKFAMAEAKLTKSGTEIPTFGLRNAFAKPTNYIRLSELCSDENFRNPIVHYRERGQFWYADDENLYIRYVSNATTLGYDIANWPESFTLFVAYYLAQQAADRINPDKQQRMDALFLEAKTNALAKDAVAGPTQFPPQGNWLSVRFDRHRGRNSNNSLYGS